MKTLERMLFELEKCVENNINEEQLRYIAGIFSQTLSKSIYDIIKENSIWERRRAVGIDEMCRIFNLGKVTMKEICAEKDSPAFKNGGRTSPWLCFPEDMHKYLLKKALPYKS